MDVLEKIAQERAVRGWSEYQLAEKAGLPQSTISPWYRKNIAPSYSSLQKICRAFQTTPAQFLSEPGEPITLTDSQAKLLQAWSRLTPAQQKALLTLMNSLSKN